MKNEKQSPGVINHLDKPYSPLSLKDFNLFQALIYKQTGIQFNPSKREFLEARIGRRLKALGIRSFKEYYARVMEKKDVETYRLMESICTHETHFFRDPRQFDFLESQLFPTWKAKAASGLMPRRIRVWSAACSSGEEPYSLAMVLWTYFPPSSGWKIEILASDLSREVLEEARAGIWPIEKAKEIPERFLKTFMLKGHRSKEGKLKAGPEIRSIIQFEHINLNDNAYPVTGLFDMIFCRNVLIYFDNESRTRVIHNLLNSLSPEGFLFLGHSETLNSEKDRVIGIIPTIYIQSPKIKLRSPA